jgi:TetR/AcrR family transcriptional repressor of bet genes
MGSRSNTTLSSSWYRACVTRISNRERLLDATWSSIADYGIRGLRLEDVAQRAGVAISLIYYHFGNRIDLLTATMEYANSRSPVIAMAATPNGLLNFARIEEGILRDFDQSKTARSNAIVWNEFTAWAVFEPEFRSQMAGATQSLIRDLSVMIEGGQKDGSVRMGIDAETEAELLVACLDGLLMRWISYSLPRKRARELMKHTIRERLAPL